MLSKIIEQELFNIAYVTNEMIISHISEEIEKFQLTVFKVDNNDLAITFHFMRDNINGELRIDRLDKIYEITVKYDEWYFLPERGDWKIINDYLLKICYEQE